MKTIMKKFYEKGIKGLALTLALTLFLGTAVSCTFPFELDSEKGTQAPSDGGSENPSASSGKNEIVFPDLSTEDETREDIIVPDTDQSIGVAYDVSDMVEAVMPSMVAITVKATTTQGGGIFGGSFEYEAEGSGSGIIIAQGDGCLYIVTNNHVVADTHKIEVTFADDKSCEAVIKGTNEQYDLAIIVVQTADMDESTLETVRIARIGDSDLLKLGQGAVAIGNALGYGQSVTLGCISALGRTVESTDGASVPLIQTDAAINPGNSGGALLNLQGEVIGINSLKYASTDVEGMGYAIPITAALPVMYELINEVQYDENRRGYLGVSCTPIANPQGLYVSNVGSGSPADKAGIQKGDVIQTVNGKEVTSVATLTDILSHLTGGDSVTICFSRRNGTGYEKMEVTATLVTRASATD